MRGQQELVEGDVLGNRYRIHSVIGRGGMSTVYLAEDLRLPGKRRAVKETRVEADEAYTGLAEADMLVRLNHPNLPDIVDYYADERGGSSYLVMDYIEGETLLQRFERRGRRMELDQVLNYILQLCDLFDYLHSRRPEPIIYRDLKPSNLMFDAQERLRLIDFGIARSYKAGQAADTVRIGTVGFAAPEQFEGRQTDERTDLYGLGALMYFLLSGGLYCHAGRKQLHELDAKLPARLADLVEKLLQADPAGRCRNAAEVREELLRVQAERRLQGVAASIVGEAQSGGNAAQPPRILAVGALYSGAGATFAAIALARALHGLGVPHAVAEAPKQQPELHALLFGEKHAPPGYRSYNAAGADPRRDAAWVDGTTLWLPSAAESTDGGMGSSRWVQPLLELDRPVLLIDIGADWQRPDIRELLGMEHVDIVYVVDPMLHKLELESTRIIQLQLQQLRQSGKRVYGVANKMVTSGHTGQWLRVLPEPPLCMLPAIDYAKIAEASWLGLLVQDRPVVQQQLVRAVKPWLREWLEERESRTVTSGTLHALRKLWKNG
ncbi:serine/threonine protein kinase [Paenibacillus sp. UNC451MF]|uniref:serine/threonine protein kinase n=1 Tax=Paenibacillus sp. UNC451MF TaxID=1449063 RepID=UPI0006925A7D|nr:serine/threonine-protein kinase [Paenibacillus sp. UNC451MF]